VISWFQAFAFKFNLYRYAAAETNEKREVFSNVVIGLLVISFVVPMVQYFGYVAGDPDFGDD
jgi:hypothetical protein